MANIRDPDIPANLGAFRALQDEVRRLDALVEKLRTPVDAEQNVAAQQERAAAHAVARQKRIRRERDIERHLVKHVRELGGEVRKVVWPGRRGAPDRLVMLPPDYCDHVRLICAGIGCQGATPAKTIWVELKAPGVEPESHQLREHKRMRAMGQRVVVIDSFEGVEELLS